MKINLFTRIALILGIISFILFVVQSCNKQSNNILSIQTDNFFNQVSESNINDLASTTNSAGAASLPDTRNQDSQINQPIKVKQKDILYTKEIKEQAALNDGEFNFTETNDQII